MTKAYKLADGSLSTDCKVGDKFIVMVVDNEDIRAGVEVGNVVTADYIEGIGFTLKEYEGSVFLYWNQVKPLKPRSMTIAEIHKEFNVKVKL